MKNLVYIITEQNKAGKGWKAAPTGKDFKQYITSVSLNKIYLWIYEGEISMFDLVVISMFEAFLHFFPISFLIFSGI